MVTRKQLQAIQLNELQNLTPGGQDGLTTEHFVQPVSGNVELNSKDKIKCHSSLKLLDTGSNIYASMTVLKATFYEPWDGVPGGEHQAKE